METDRQQSGFERERGSTRRAFLRQTLGLAAAAAITRPGLLLGQSDESAAAQGAASAAKATETAKAAGVTRELSKVVQVTSDRVLPARVVQRPLLKDLIQEGLTLYTGAPTPADAWHKILKPDDVILIKFNGSAAERIGTREAMVDELVGSLMAAGWGPDRIILLEEGQQIAQTVKTKKADLRWQQDKIPFGKSGKDSFIAALDEATAIINVPFLKTHHLAVMTSCLKNLSHGLIQHPARFHANGCDPAIGEIVASKQIRSKLRLNIVNALRVVFDRGPEASEDDMATVGALLVGADPVACDAVGFGILNGARSTRKMAPLLPQAKAPAQLVTASGLGVGKYDMEWINLQSLSM